VRKALVAKQQKSNPWKRDDFLVDNHGEKLWAISRDWRQISSGRRIVYPNVSKDREMQITVGGKLCKFVVEENLTGIF